MQTALFQHRNILCLNFKFSGSYILLSHTGEIEFNKLCYKSLNQILYLNKFIKWLNGHSYIIPFSLKTQCVFMLLDVRIRATFPKYSNSCIYETDSSTNLFLIHVSGWLKLSSINSLFKEWHVSSWDTHEHAELITDLLIIKPRNNFIDNYLSVFIYAVRIGTSYKWWLLSFSEQTFSFNIFVSKILLVYIILWITFTDFKFFLIQTLLFSIQSSCLQLYLDYHCFCSNWVASVYSKYLWFINLCRFALFRPLCSGFSFSVLPFRSFMSTTFLLRFAVFQSQLKSFQESVSMLS